MDARRPPQIVVGHSDVLRIALPITLSNATVPLIGFVDTAVIGQLGRPELMGGVAIGSLIFTMLYWTFGFLRMGTTGLTAQALGAAQSREIAGHLLRALMVAVVASLLIVLLQWPIREAALGLTGGSVEVAAAARTYYDIRIWAAPAGLVNFALLGWFVGLGRAGTAFFLQLLLNLGNVGLAVAFVLGLGHGVAGVGVAALVAEYVAAFAGLVVALATARRLGATAPLSDALDRRRLRHAFAINIDITIRTVATFVVLTFFTAQSAAAGDVTLAANALLINMKNIVVYLLDGFAFAVEALVGRTIGARDRASFRRAIVLSTWWAGVFAITLGFCLWLVGDAVIVSSAKSPQVQTAARAFLAWAALTPIVGVWCFQLDGIFIGATRTRDMRNMMLLSVMCFFAAWIVLGPMFGNHGLWASWMVFYVARAATLYSRLSTLERGAFGP